MGRGERSDRKCFFLDMASAENWNLGKKGNVSSRDSRARLISRMRQSCKCIVFGPLQTKPKVISECVPSPFGLPVLETKKKCWRLGESHLVVFGGGAKPFWISRRCQVASGRSSMGSV